MVKWELLRLFKQKKTFIGLAIILLLAVFMGLSFSLLANLETSGVDVTVPGGMPMTYHPLIFALMIFSSNTGMLIPLFSILAIVDLYTGDYTKGTLKSLMIRPISRTKIFFAKFISCYAYSLFFLSCAAIFGIAVGYLFFDTSQPLVMMGVGEVGMGGYDMIEIISFSGGLDYLLNLLIVIVGSSLPLMAFGALVALAAVSLNTVSGVNFLAIGYLLISSILQPFLKPMKYVLNSTHMGIGIEFIMSSVKLGDQTTPILVILSTLIVATLGAWLVFKKKEILL